MALPMAWESLSHMQRHFMMTTSLILKTKVAQAWKTKMTQRLKTKVAKCPKMKTASWIWMMDAMHVNFRSFFLDELHKVKRPSNTMQELIE
jgi:hypothetical protein